MSAIRDNWERLVGAVLRKEELRQLCYADSIDPSTRSESSFCSSSFNLSSPTSDLAASSWRQSLNPARFSRDILLRKNEESKETDFTDHQYPGFHSPEAVLPREILEPLRKEKFAIPYRSEMDNGITTVVKRLRDASISERRYFDGNMEASGTISRSENVASREVFFSYEDETLIIYEYQSHGVVSTFVQHEKKKFEMHELEWETRVRIAISVARAIANAHSQCNNKLPDGDIKAANDCFSDLGLEKMAEVSIVFPTAGYRAPEVNNDRPPSQASDIYSFGVLLLELLTGAFPINGNVVDRIQLVRSVTHKFLEAGTLVVFDFVPVRNPTALIEMWKMLLVAIRCLEENPEQRPESADVLKMMEDIKSINPMNGD